MTISLIPEVARGVIVEGDERSGAIFSADRKFRYALWRYWNIKPALEGNARAVMLTLANPSVAGAYRDDPTVVKCAHYGQRWQFDGMYIGNVMAEIGTHYMDRGLKRDPGPFCDEYLGIMRNSSALHIAAWGFMQQYYPERAKAVRRMFLELYYLELAKDGFPKHPLYLRADLKPTLWLPSLEAEEG